MEQRLKAALPSARNAELRCPRQGRSLWKTALGRAVIAAGERRAQHAVASAGDHSGPAGIGGGLSDFCRSDHPGIRLSAPDYEPGKKAAKVASAFAGDLSSQIAELKDEYSVGEIWDEFGGLKAMDIIMIICWFAMIAAAFVVRQQLVQYRRNAPKYLVIFILLPEACISCIPWCGRSFSAAP